MMKWQTRNPQQKRSVLVWEQACNTTAQPGRAQQATSVVLQFALITTGMPDVFVVLPA